MCFSFIGPDHAVGRSFSDVFVSLEVVRLQRSLFKYEQTTDPTCAGAEAQMPKA